MNDNAALPGMARVLALGLVLWTSAPAVVGAEATITRTNWSDRWITNVIEITMPINRFVNEYRTNQVTQLRTNIVDVYVTNQVMRTLTNPVVVEAAWTNCVNSYETNWMMRRMTNLVVREAAWTNVVVAYRTNWHTRTLTRHLAVTALRTNLVDAFRTNWSTLNLTNWQTVVLFKTNWITQPVTNVVQIDVPVPPVATAPAPSAVVESKEASVQIVSSAPGGAWPGPLTIEATRTARPPANNLVEVQLKARWTRQTTAPLHVQSWRVEREDGEILLFGPEQAFTRQLPVGKYKVEAKVRSEGDNPPLSVRGTLSVTTRDVFIQPKLLVRK